MSRIVLTLNSHPDTENPSAALIITTFCGSVKHSVTNDRLRAQISINNGHYVAISREQAKKIVKALIDGFELL